MRIFCLVLLALVCFAADDKPEPKSPATLLVEKAIADNSKDAEKAYAAYLKALEVANAKVLKVLEGAKKDLNDPTKGKLSISERAKALEELEGKVKEIKDGMVGSVIVEKSKVTDDLLDSKPKVEKPVVFGKPDPKDPLIGVWKAENSSHRFQFNPDGTFMNDGAWKGRWASKGNKSYAVAIDNNQGYPDVASMNRTFEMIDEKSIKENILGNESIYIRFLDDKGKKAK